MDPKKGVGKQLYSGASVTFAPQTSLKRDVREKDRQDSLTVNAMAKSQNFLKQPRRESASLLNPSLHGGVSVQVPLSNSAIGDPNECRFNKKWRILATLQILFGLLSVAVNLYSHFPLFSFGWQLTRGEDKLWYGTWTGAINIICGIIGSAASKPGMPFSPHKFLRRSYFILNCSFVPFANGIGLAAFGITMSAYPLICNSSITEKFTLVMAFINFCLLVVCIFLNIFGIVYQVLATVRCKCWICDPKNRALHGYIKT
jgi:hypothetical protein